MPQDRPRRVKGIRSTRPEGKQGRKGESREDQKGMPDAQEMQSAVSGGDGLWFLNTGVVRQKGTEMT